MSTTAPTRRFRPGTLPHEEQRRRILDDLADHVGESWPMLPDPAILAGNPALIHEALPALRASLDVAERAYRRRTDAIRLLLDVLEDSLGADVVLDHVARVRAAGGA